MELCEQIKQTRLALRLTQPQLGAELGVSAALIAQWERGEALPEHSRLLELALQQVQFEHGYWVLDEATRQHLEKSYVLLQESKRELEQLIKESAC